jgi:hypothetical protein
MRPSDGAGGAAASAQATPAMAKNIVKASAFDTTRIDNSQAGA